MAVSNIITTGLYINVAISTPENAAEISLLLEIHKQKRTPENSTSIFLNHFWKLHFFFNSPNSVPTLPFPQEISYPEPAHGFWLLLSKKYVFQYYPIDSLF